MSPGRRPPEEKEQVLQLAREKNSVKVISEITKVSRETIYFWLRSAGITPHTDRAPRTTVRRRADPGGRPMPGQDGVKTLGNLPLALRIERGVAKRVAEMDDAA